MQEVNKISKSIVLNRQVVNYEVIRKNVKNINLRIRSDCSVTISANMNVSEDVIAEFITKKSELIVSNLNRFEELKKYEPEPKQFISGESFYLLGKNLRLKVVEGIKEDVFNDGIYLYLTVKNKEDFNKKQKLINKYFDNQCAECFSEIIETIYPTFAKYGVKQPQLKIRTMETRWGSCMPRKGVITLNKHLIEAPRNCIEYVVLHEYCHFIHPNHSKQFYNFVSMLMPDWKERKKILESIHVGQFQVLCKLKI